MPRFPGGHYQAIWEHDLGDVLRSAHAWELTMAHTTANGLRIEYSDSAGGGRPLLCLTGWCSSRERYDAFVEGAAGRRRVLALDWRGHGGSDPPVDDFGVDEMTRDALDIIDAAGLDEFAIVSASHSGWVAIELRRTLGRRVPEVAHLDWLVTEPSQPYLDLIRTLQSERSWEEARDTLFRIWRGGLDRPEIENVIAVMNRHGAEMWMRSGRSIEAMYARHGSPLAAWSMFDERPRVLHLYGQPADPAYLELQRGFSAEHPWFRVERLSARSHFSMVETPEQALAAIEDFLGD